MTCHRMPRFYLFELRLRIPAYIHNLQATRLEAAPGRWINRLRNFASDFGNGSLIGRIGDWHRGDKGLGIRVMRIGDHVLGVPQFHYPAQIHDHQTLRDIGQNGEVVGNIDARKIHALGQVPDQIQYSGANGNIKHR